MEMKLLFCKKCHSVFNLTYRIKKCSCKLTSGKYTDPYNAIYKGEFAVPLGFANHNFLQVVRSQSSMESGAGKRFDAFVISKKCDTFTFLV